MSEDTSQYKIYSQTDNGRSLVVWLEETASHHPLCYDAFYSIEDRDPKKIAVLVQTFTPLHYIDDRCDDGFLTFFESRSKFHGTDYLDDALVLCEEYSGCAVADNGRADDGSYYRFRPYITVVSEHATEDDFRSVYEAVRYCTKLAKKAEA